MTLTFASWPLTLMAWPLTLGGMTSHPVKVRTRGQISETDVQIQSQFLSLDLCPMTLDLDDVTSDPWGHHLRPCKGQNWGSNLRNGCSDSVKLLSTFRPRYSKIMTLTFAPWPLTLMMWPLTLGFSSWFYVILISGYAIPCISCGWPTATKTLGC